MQIDLPTVLVILSDFAIDASRRLRSFARKGVCVAGGKFKAGSITLLPHDAFRTRVHTEGQSALLTTRVYFSTHLHK